MYNECLAIKEMTLSRHGAKIIALVTEIVDAGDIGKKVADIWRALNSSCR